MKSVKKLEDIYEVVNRVKRVSQLQLMMCGLNENEINFFQQKGLIKLVNIGMGPDLTQYEFSDIFIAERNQSK